MMTDENRDEFEVLRRRAYGPHPDIHLDPQALARLRELENSRRPLNPAPRGDHERVSSEPPRAAVVEVIVDEPDPGENDERARINWSWARELFTSLLKVRRSTALIILSAAVVVILAMTALTLVQRVQADPLQVGAEQIARLSVDSSYEIPQILALSAEGNETQAFQDFYGLRTVAGFGTAGWFFSTGTGDCLSVISAADVHPDESFSDGLLTSGCAAGGFPAATQFEIDAHGVPEELRSAFPDSSAFQFVLDADNREIVVFMTD
ncbi:MAG: hypothetical protein ACOH19_00670 [Rhodoglobus sp.]